MPRENNRATTNAADNTAGTSILSAMPGIRYPALPSTADSVVLALLYQYAQSERWSEQTLRRQQLRQAQRLVRHALQHVPFYAAHRAGLEAFRDNEADASAWHDIPPVRRSEIQDAGDSMTSRHIPPGHGPTRWISTSGSTARPLRVLSSALQQPIYRAMSLRNFLWHGFDFDGKVAAIRPAPPGTAEPPRGRREKGYWTAVHRTGPAVLLSVNTSVTAQLAWLQREAPDYLLSYPTVLHALATAALADGVRLPQLRAISSFGETLGAEVRETCRQAFGVAIIDSYSANENGICALQCPVSGHYHVMSENILLEVLDDNGRPCAPGEVGRVVITSLHNFAMPLIRYVIGDYAELGAPCACGRGLPVLKRILGRARDRVLLPSGERRWIAISGADLSAIKPLRQWQMVQRSRELVDVKLVLARALTDAERSRLTATLHGSLGYPFQLRFYVVDEIPREPGGKFTEFHCDIAEPLV